MKAESVRAEVVNWVLLVAGVVCLGGGIYYGVIGSGALAAVGLAAGLLLLFGATIERFERIKGLGMEAQTRKIDDKLHHADSIVQNLREVTETVLPVLVSMNARAGVAGRGLIQGRDSRCPVAVGTHARV